jgi:hypothetical protein
MLWYVLCSLAHTHTHIIISGTICNSCSDVAGRQTGDRQ